MPTVEIKLDLTQLTGIRRAACEASLDVVSALRGEIITAQVVPFNVGKLQDSIGAIDQFVDGESLHTALCVGDTAYARRLYFHPEYNFQKVNNPNARGRWADPWLPGGEREEFLPKAFEKRMEARMPK